MGISKQAGLFIHRSPSYLPNGFVFRGLGMMFKIRYPLTHLLIIHEFRFFLYAQMEITFLSAFMIL